MKRFLPLLLILGFITACGGGRTMVRIGTEHYETHGEFEFAMIALLNVLSERAERKDLRVVFEDIYLEETRVVTPLSSFVRRSLMAASGDSGVFRLIQSEKDYSQIDNKAMSYAISEEFDAVLVMNYYEEFDKLRFYVTLNKSDSREIITTTSMVMSRTILPWELSMQSFVPVNFSAYKSLDYEKPVVQNDYESRVWTDRGVNAVYKDGEYMRLNIKVEKDSYIKLIHIDVNNKAQLIFPNQFSRKNFVKAGDVYTIPTREMEEKNFRFRLTEPYGLESIRLISQTSQFDDLKDFAFATPVKDLGYYSGAQSRGMLLEGVSVDSDVEQSESIYIYNIVK